MGKGVKASPTLRLGSCLAVAVLALLVTGASANASKAPSIIYWSIRQAQQMCDMPLPRGHENDGAPLMEKRAVQGSVDARALHLCQQWNYVVAQMQSEGKMAGYKLKPIIPAEQFHDVKGLAADVEASRKGGPATAGAYPAVDQAIAGQGMPADGEHSDVAEGVHNNANENFKGPAGEDGGANALADDVLFVGGAFLAGFAIRHLWNMRSSSE